MNCPYCQHTLPVPARNQNLSCPCGATVRNPGVIMWQPPTQGATKEIARAKEVVEKAVEQHVQKFVKMGKKGGKRKSKRKAEVARINGTKPCHPGKERGRPRIQKSLTEIRDYWREMARKSRAMRQARS